MRRGRKRLEGGMARVREARFVVVMAVTVMLVLAAGAASAQDENCCRRASTRTSRQRREQGKRWVQKQNLNRRRYRSPRGPAKLLLRRRVGLHQRNRIRRPRPP